MECLIKTVYFVYNSLISLVNKSKGLVSGFTTNIPALQLDVSPLRQPLQPNQFFSFLPVLPGTMYKTIYTESGILADGWHLLLLRPDFQPAQAIRYVLQKKLSQAKLFLDYLWLSFPIIWVMLTCRLLTCMLSLPKLFTLGIICLLSYPWSLMPVTKSSNLLIPKSLLNLCRTTLNRMITV